MFTITFFYLYMGVIVILRLAVPCSYQGTKQSISKEIVNLMFKLGHVNRETKFYDLCCGSGAISLELINNGISPKNITMLDKSTWGLFWEKIGKGELDIKKLNSYLDSVPSDKFQIQAYLKNLSKENPNIDEEYKYILLQAGSFGGKQIWKSDGVWKNTSFRSYWLPTDTSNRQTPNNPMHPMPNTIKRRMKLIISMCKGITGLQMDVFDFLDYTKNKDMSNSIIYLDPPYKDTTQYGYGFDWEVFLEKLLKLNVPVVFVSECKKYSDIAYKLKFNGARGCINGNSTYMREEWLNIYYGLKT